MAVISKKISVVYHSEYKSVENLAKSIATGAKLYGADVYIASCKKDVDINMLNASDAIIFGCPTYMGGLSGEMKVFLDKLVDVWSNQYWRNKICAGFTCSSAPSGDKLNALMQFTLFAAQNSMIWVGPETLTREQRDGLPFNYNRLGGWLGLMSQSDDFSIEGSGVPSEDDLKTAEFFGKHIAEVCEQFKK